MNTYKNQKDNIPDSNVLSNINVEALCLQVNLILDVQMLSMRQTPNYSLNVQF